MGKIENLHAEPFADALEKDPTFGFWLLRKTVFADFADEARLLNREMLAKRSPTAKNWWQSHYQEKSRCGCAGCCGRETDILAIFQNATGMRFALHIEVKHPGDGFKKKDQAAAYPLRAQCWVKKTPERVLAHAYATTALLFSNNKRDEYAPHLGHFRTLITLEEVKENFPNASARGSGQIPTLSM